MSPRPEEEWEVALSVAALLVVLALLGVLATFLLEWIPGVP